MSGHRMTLRTALVLPAAAVAATLFLVMLPAATAPAQAQTAQVQATLRIVNLGNNVDRETALQHFRDAGIESERQNPIFILYFNSNKPDHKELNDLYFRALRASLQRTKTTIVLIDEYYHPHLSRGNEAKIEGATYPILPFSTALVDNKLVNNVTTTLVTTAKSGKHYSIQVPGIAIQGKADDKEFARQLLTMFVSMESEATKQYRIAHPSASGTAP